MMVKYRRNKLDGGIYFFTVTLRNRRSNLLTEHIKLLGDAMRKTRDENFYKTRAIVVLPDHIHALWEMPLGGKTNPDDYSIRWRKIKSYFTKAIIKAGVKINKKEHGGYDLWQRRFWEHTIRNEKDLEKHINYIHYNPVKHRLVKQVSDWPHSSFHAYVRAGTLTHDWGGMEEETGFGE